MVNSGFEESQSGYVAQDVQAGQFRRFGEFGPAYEILNIKSESHAGIRVIATGEELDYRLDRLKRDPIATTIP